MQKLIKPGRQYFIINIDEPYAGDIFDVLKQGQMQKGEWPEGDITFKDWIKQTWSQSEKEETTAGDLVKEWGEGLVGKTVLTSPIENYPGGISEVIDVCSYLGSVTKIAFKVKTLGWVNNCGNNRVLIANWEICQLIESGVKL